MSEDPPGGRGRPGPPEIRVQLATGVELRVSGRLDASLAILVEAFEASRPLGDRGLQIAAARELGLTLLALSRLSEAEELLTTVLDESASHFGTDSPQWASAAEELALGRRARGDLKGALLLQRDAYEASARSLGRTDPVTLALGQIAREARRSRWPLLLLYFDSPDRETEWPRELSELFLRIGLSEPSDLRRGRYYSVLSTRLRERPPEDTGVETYLFQSLLGRAITSEPLYLVGEDWFDLARRVVDERASTLGPDHPQTVNSRLLLSHAIAPRDVREAIVVGRQAASQSERLLGRGHVDTLGAYESLAGLLDQGGEGEEAVHLRSENLVLRAADEGIIGDSQPPIENLAGTLTEPLTRIDSDTEPRGVFERRGKRLFLPDLVEPVASAPGAPGPAAPDDTDAAQNEVVRRTAHVELDPPGPIGQGDRFEVSVFVDDAVASGPGVGELVFDPPSGAEELTLRIWLVVSRHFEVEGDTIRQLTLDLKKRSTPKLTFRVLAAHADEYADEEPHVRALFSYLGWPSGEVQLSVPLEAAAPEVER